MNFIDVIVIVLIILYGLNGLYRGFLPSILNLGGFFLSWICAFLFYPLLSRSLSSSAFFSSLKFYIEGSERVGNFELARMSISSFSGEELNSVLSSAELPPPFKTAVLSNIQNKAFEADGIFTLGEYFDATIYNVIINIIAFLILFAVLRIVFTLLVNAYSYANPLPELKHFDHPLGAGIALIRGFLSMYMLFALIPIALILMPVSFVTDIVNSSFMSSIFYNGSIILRFISGTG